MWEWMLTRLTVITLQRIQIRNHYVEHLKLMLYVNHTSKKKKKTKTEIIYISVEKSLFC